MVDAIGTTKDAVAEQRALRAELITAKVKTERTEQAGRLLDGVDFARCPQCGVDISGRVTAPGCCKLCGSGAAVDSDAPSLEIEAIRRELNDRIDQIADSIERRQRTLERSNRQLERFRSEKKRKDDLLQRKLANYDSAYVESIREVDREVATLIERRKSLLNLQEMPKAINGLKKETGELQGEIDNLRSAIGEERTRLQHADENVAAIAGDFKAMMIAVGFPGVVEADNVVLDPRSWAPSVQHLQQEWGFWDAGSGGKKTLFNVCYALALHKAARRSGMPVPTVLIIDSPTKNISKDENPQLVAALYREVYRLATAVDNHRTQFLLIDSNFVGPLKPIDGMIVRHLAGTPEAPSLFPHYQGP